MKKKELMQKNIVICMHKKKGFSLLSFLLYLMLFSLMTLFLCHIIVSLVIPSLSSIRRCQSVIALHITSDLFVRDVKAIDHWKVMQPHELIWHADDQDIGWYCTDNCLKRNTGTYDQEWKHKTTSIVAAGVKKVIFTAEKVQDQIIGIEMKLMPVAAQKKPVICYVVVKEKEAV